jgi:hypothetical protein
MRTRNQSGRIKGFRPTLKQFNETLEIAQQGIDTPTSVAIRYKRGDSTISSEPDVQKIAANELSKLVSEADKPAILDNIQFTISQQNPMRRVSIVFDASDWTYYTVESTDATWALGRFHELTEMLLGFQGLYAQVDAPLPEIVVSGYYRAWGAAALWAPKRDRGRERADFYSKLPYVALIFLVTIVLIIIIPPALTHSVATEIALVSLAVAAGFAAFFYSRWLRTLLRSHIEISEPTGYFRSILSSKNTDPVGNATLYATLIGIIVAILAIAVGH